MANFAELESSCATESSAIHYLIDQRILPETSCQHCGAETPLWRGGTFRCRRKGCRKLKNVFQNTVFYRRNKPFREILEFMWCYVVGKFRTEQFFAPCVWV